MMIAKDVDLPMMDFSLEFPDDHARYRHYRNLAPVCRTPIGSYIALRHRHGPIATHPEMTRQMEMESMALQGIASGPIYDFFEAAMLFANGDAHRRRRGPVSRAFAFKMVEGMRNGVAALAEEIVRERLGKGPFDFLYEVAGEIPARVIAGALGVPQEDAGKFRDWVYGAIRMIGLHDPAIRPQIERDVESLVGYVDDLLSARRRRPEDDFMSRYLFEVESAGEMSPAEIRTQIAGVILAGADTTRLSIAATLTRLLQHPEQWVAFCADPDALKKRVAEEGLRYDPAVSGVPRFALADLDIDGCRVPKDSVLSWSIMSSMRDDEVYADPDRFDIFRTDHPRWSPAFGAGAHRCLGEALARAELEETLAAIARLAPRTTLVGAPPRVFGVAGVRQIDRMEAAFA
ncbi:MAG: cytochrome P450 [Parvularculaceae bacterium]|nr:cytochrome P450 [Parvularculaceae bacterium]